MRARLCRNAPFHDQNFPAFLCVNIQGVNAGGDEEGQEKEKEKEYFIS